MKNSLIIFGSSSTIANNIIRLIDMNKYLNIYCFSRSKLEISDKFKKQKIHNYYIDHNEVQEIRDILKIELNKLDISYDILICHGKLENDGLVEDKFVNIFNNNCLSQIKIIEAIFSISLKHNKIGVITSVAGDLIRRSKFEYTFAKQILNKYLKYQIIQKQRNILVFKIGPTDTKMTKSEVKKFYFSKPYIVAAQILKAFENNKSGIFYIPKYWYFILNILRILPIKLIDILKL